MKKPKRQQSSGAEEKVIIEEKELKETDPLDINYPLLREFREKAPGSFKHAQSLANTIENVAASINLDSDELKMAAMYHDIGKMWAPEFFSENQPSDINIHDNLDPQISYHILTRHVSDSVTVLIAHNFPPTVIRIISQHHGTMILRAIYEKAQKISKNKISDESFRYKTRKPDSLESLMLLLCDQLEATSRSLYADQHQDMEHQDIDVTTFVTSIFNKLMMDGQFNDVEIRLGYLSKIQEALVNDIAGNFHKRVKYDEDDTLMKEKVDESKKEI